jgi:hypothetical protein
LFLDREKWVLRAENPPPLTETAIVNVTLAISTRSKRSASKRSGARSRSITVPQFFSDA